MYDPYLTFYAVEKRFGKTQALDGVSFAVGAGEIFGFIGPNGSGKTTAIRIMLGFYRADQGEVRLFGQDPAVAMSSIGPRVGVMLEQQGLYDHLTATEYLELYAGMFGLRRPESAQRLRDILALVGLSDRAGDRLRSFSKGMRQRVAFARSLVNKPLLLIMDEPFDGIDAEARRDLLQLIPKVVRERGVSVFLTSHNLAEIEQLCDRVAVIKKGRILACDSTNALKTNRHPSAVLVVKPEAATSFSDVERILSGLKYELQEDVIKVDLGASNMGRSDVLRLLLDHGIGIECFREEQASLEDAYFSLTGGEGDV